MSRVALLAICALLALGGCCAQQGPAQAPSFIRIANGRFVDDQCNEWLFSGWNGWQILEHALNDRAYLTNKFQQAQNASLNLMRFFVTGDDGPLLTPSSPGQLDAGIAQGLDYILAEAGRHGIRVTPVLMNLWKESGVPTFERFCGTASSSVKPRPDLDIRPGPLNASERLQTPYAWLTSTDCRQQVKDFISAIVNRKNSITGTLYRDDPTIFSWNLFNEPRCKYCGPQPVDDWIGDIAAHLKSVDPNHLVTVGEEGFFAEGDPMQSFNADDANKWAALSGQDFRANHAHAAIDYAAIHMWPDNWRNPPLDTGFGQRWIESHMQVAQQLGKPLVLEEFGKNAYENQISSVRDPWFSLANSEVEQSLRSGGALRGSLFWQWDGESGARNGDGSNIRTGDSTFQQYIAPFARKLAATAPAKVPGCTPAAASGQGGQGLPSQPLVQAYAQPSGRRLLHG